MTDAFDCLPGSAYPRRVAIARLLSAPGGRMSGGPVTVTSDPGLQFRVVDAFGDLTEALALSGPVLIGVDDLQWADPSSLVALAAIGRRLDAYRDLARANALLRLAGVQRGVRGARKRPQFGWESLTPTERTVVTLVADGLTNPQIGERLFISRRTVQAHLVHVFAKLGISSRT